MDSIEKTKQFISILQAFVDGKRVQAQHKGFSGWGEIKEVGMYRHQWDTRNENYRVVDDNGDVIFEVGKEFDDTLSANDHIELQKKAFLEAKEILTGGEKGMWHHYCVRLGGTAYVSLGKECGACGETKKPILKVI